MNEEYKNWNWGDIVLLTAPTGTGKSHFILYDLLKWAIEKNYKILYLVNRKILKSQIETEIKNEVSLEMYRIFNGGVVNVQNYITVLTYQSIEKILKEDIGKAKWFSQFSYIVYDECHYFYADSNFNTNTELSYDCLRRAFHEKIQIFISATMKNIKRMIESRPARFLLPCEVNYSISISKLFLNTGLKQYTLEKDYSYLNIHTFDNMEELIEKIHMTKSKWLIFVDSIEQGKELKNNLTKENDKLSEKEVVFIDASYETTDETAKEVEGLVENKCIKKKIVICTAVMDNGISFIDTGLRNIVILADTEESFIQMLGRKRTDGNKVELYICVRDVLHFSRRKSYVDSIISLYNNYSKLIDEISVLKTESMEYPLTPYAKGLYLNRIGDE